MQVSDEEKNKKETLAPLLIINKKEIKGFRIELAFPLTL
jgi:hypothetical protein